MRIAFLILNYKTYNDTIRVVHEILALGLRDFNITVVDNDSPNESKDVLIKELSKVDNVDLLFNKVNEGYAKGNNLGLRHLQKYNPEYVVIMNNDVHFSKEVIESLIDVYSKIPNAGAISPLQKLPDGSIAQYSNLDHPTFVSDILSYTSFSRRKHKYVCNTIYSNLQEVAIIPGAFIFTKFARFKEIGFFYENTFLFCEERFTARRFADHGYKNYLVLDCTYLHEHSKTIKTNVANNIQRKFLLDGKVLYTYEYRKLPRLKSIIITFFYKLELFTSNIKKSISHVRH